MTTVQTTSLNLSEMATDIGQIWPRPPNMRLGQNRVKNSTEPEPIQGIQASATTALFRLLYFTTKSATDPGNFYPFS
jgi:hypothetical protein